MQISSLPKKNSPGKENVKAFVVYVTFLNLNLMPIHPAQKTKIALLVIQKMQIPSEYSDFSDIFSKKEGSILPKIPEMSQHAIELQAGQQPSYRPIHSLGLVELKTLKTYIKTNLANGFIWSSKSPAGAFIFFVGKPDSSLRL